MICFSQHFSDTNFYILIHFSCYGFTKISSLGILKPSVLLFFILYTLLSRLMQTTKIRYHQLSNFPNESESFGIRPTLSSCREVTFYGALTTDPKTF